MIELQNSYMTVSPQEKLPNRKIIVEQELIDSMRDHRFPNILDMGDDKFWIIIPPVGTKMWDVSRICRDEGKPKRVEYLSSNLEESRGFATIHEFNLTDMQEIKYFINQRLREDPKKSNLLHKQNT